MNVRKQRQHQCGLTNVDFRTKGDINSVDRFNPSLKYTDMGTMSKTNFKHALPQNVDAKEKWKTQGGWAPQRMADPITDDAKTFYMESKKSLKNMVNLGKKHDELQREAWTDKVYVGDNVYTTATMAQAAAKRDEELHKDNRHQIQGEEDDKKKQAAKAAPIESKLSLKSAGVEIVMIKDIRRALRRKYASRSNLDRIFKQWDQNQSGQVSAEELWYGLNKIGIRSSLEESMALVASAASTNGNLDLQQFGDLLFSKDEQLKVDLDKIEAPGQEEKIKAFEHFQLYKQPIRLDLEQLNAEQKEQFRHRNNWRDLLKKQVREISAEVQMNDADKSLTVDPNHLMRIIEKRVEVPHQLREHKDMLYDYIREFCDDQTGKIHYAVMARDLQQFNFDKETNFGIVPRSAQSISSGKHSIQAVDPKRTVFNSNFDVYDTKRIPQNQLEQIEKRVVKMNRLFRDKFKTEANLQASLQKVPADANQNLNVDDFKAFVVEQCREELIERKVSKQDVESFMSAFTFNNHGATCVEKVAPLVFETDVNKVATNLTTRVRANPPPALANEDLGTTVRGADKIDNEVNKRMRGLLEQIENKVFDSKPRFYHVFKQMDMDNDGYISYKDFEQHLEKNKIFASKDEIVTLMHNVLDTEQKGYIDFTTFQKRIKPRMSDQVKVEENEVYANNLIPNLDKLNEYGEKSKSLKQSVSHVNQMFRPDPDTIKLTQATRFGAKPTHQNTFGHYQHGPNYPGYLPEVERVGRRTELHMNHKVAFQSEERAKLKATQESRIREKQQRQELISARIQMQDQDLLTKDFTKTQHKAQVFDNYEKLFHLGGY